MFRTRTAAMIAASMVAGGVMVAALSPHLASAVKDSGERPVVVPITTCRAFDTRPTSQVGDRGTPLAAGETWTTTLRGNIGNCTNNTIPDDATGVVITLTALDATEPTFITAWTAGQPRPLTSVANPTPNGVIKPTSVTLDLDPTGQASFYNYKGNTHFFVDVTAYLVDHNHDDDIAAAIAEIEPDKIDAYTKEQVDQKIAEAIDTLAADTIAPWRDIPSGRTVTGVFNYNHLEEPQDNEMHLAAVTLPGRAPVPLAGPTVNFAADNSDATTDDDAECDGDAETPTAPPGKVCLYVAGFKGYDTFEGGALANSDQQQGFFIRWYANGVSKNPYVQLSWAYTAP